MERIVAQLTELQKIELKKEPIRELKADEVLINVKAVGICGSDVSYYKRGTTGMGMLNFPHVLGHECGGVIVAVGSDVKGYSVGQRVAVEPGVPCGECEYCREGKYNLCKNLSFMSTAVVRPYGDGAMADHLIRPAKMLHPIPDNVSFEQAAMIEPLSVGFHAAKIADVKMGQRVAIMGCGPIGGCLLQTMLCCGVSEVYMTDRNPQKMQIMRELGATEVFDVSGLTEDELKALLPKDVDVVFDTTCNETLINSSFHWLRKGGSLVMVGVPAKGMYIDMNAAFVREIAIRTTFRYENTYPQAIAMISAGKVAPEKLITDRFPLEKADEAMQLASAKRGDVLKVMLEV